MSAFEKYSPFIRDYIYSRNWDSLREVQIGAAEVLFGTENNLLLTSSTASGKTEAAFFPIISRLYDDPPQTFGALYIAPLKSLINDQFSRLDELLDMSGIPVFHWHGDVAMSHKNKALRDPKGILQITPESLESMLVNRNNDIVRLFGDLRYVVLDEIHTLTGTDRGNQIICQLCRISRLIGRDPVRVGLSATIGDTDIAAKWLGAGSERGVSVVGMKETRTSWRLGMEHFYIQSDSPDQSESGNKYLTAVGEATPGENEPARPEASDNSVGYTPLDPGFEYIYDCTADKKCLVFSNSREETEYLTATLRQIADRRGDPDVFLIHHGNLSASLREEAEMKLKDDELRTVTCATVTLELGIDIGRLERIVQLDAPTTVSSLLQRLGRSGRRGAPPEMMMVFREENPLPNTPLPQLMPWGLLRAIAIVQLYLEERFIEPPNVKKLPFSLLFQQTLSTLAASGELTAKRLAEKVLSLPPFAGVTKEEYRTLLLSMIKNDFIEMTEEKGLIVGLKGERLINSFKFYAVFKDSEDYTVRAGSDEIGTITTPPPVGDRFALAGRVWEVEELDVARKLIYVKEVKGKMEISWPGDYGEIHTRILERMKQVLEEDTVYPYLKKNARKRLDVARRVARNTGMLKKSIVHLGGYTWCLFPWLGTRSFRTLRKFIAKNGAKFRISGMEYEGCCYMTFKMERGDGRELISYLSKKASSEGIDKSALVAPSECPVFEKYDDFIPSELLRDAYMADRLRTDEAVKRLAEIAWELGKQ
ncbi:MAG: DEAD/DEAH box helicase [Firmicutes bacterium]|uniref:DEAD/DEAH box helicase n=1 Tax=Candidatus Colimorpha enterica TaxID=3083063 RepID=A0AAE3JZ42_9BACT|nr:DEAD/DEAH box helicase [Candidatus Colimorpha enterica]